MTFPTDVDVVVLGSGAAGLTAALAAQTGGARVAVFEKGPQFGGTSAWSGGMLWVPLNSKMESVGAADSRDEVVTYLNSLSHGTIEDHLRDSFIDNAPRMIDWLEANTDSVRFQIVENFPDYHPENPGGKPDGGRSLECPLYSFHELGAWSDRVTQGRQMATGVMMNETSLGRGLPPGGLSADEVERRGTGDFRGCGQALIGRLLRACLDAEVQLYSSARAMGLIVEDGAVVGVRVADESGVEHTVRAGGGVILATGGFEWDPSLVRSFIRGPLERSVSVPTNTGDGLKMAMRAGASLGNMREAWWLAAIDVPTGEPDGSTYAYMVNRERTRPGTIMVNRSGRRFANEAANYNAFGAAFHHLDVSTFEYVNNPAWMIFDQLYLSRYGLSRYHGDGDAPSWLVRADTVEELAVLLDLPADEFADTVARWNASCADGEDAEFGRGRSRHDTWWGDPDRPGVMATLGPIDSPPYYAVRSYSGALGTKGGPRTTADGQVVDLDEQPIPGLYACGNTMSSAMGMTYGGGGGTLGPGMTFGWLAGRHIASSWKGTEL